MKSVNYLFAISVILVAGMYGWYLMAEAINNHADVAATVIIQDTLASNIAYDIGRLRELEAHIDAGQLENAAALIRDLIELKLYMVEQCVTEKCIETYDELKK